MAKRGRNISARSRAAIKAKYEAGLLSIAEIAKQHNMTREAVSRMATREGWERGKSHAKVTRKITQRADKKLIEKEGDRLFDYASKYIKNVDYLDKAHQANLGAYFRELKESGGTLSKADADKYKTFQQFFKLAAETVKINFEGVRLAMGLDKEHGEKQDVINIINFADADDSL